MLTECPSHIRLRLLLVVMVIEHYTLSIPQPPDNVYLRVVMPVKC